MTVIISGNKAYEKLRGLIYFTYQNLSTVKLSQEQATFYMTCVYSACNSVRTKQWNWSELIAAARQGNPESVHMLESLRHFDVRIIMGKW